MDTKPSSVLTDGKWDDSFIALTAHSAAAHMYGSKPRKKLMSSPAKFEVQTSTICDGWINVWSWEEGETGPSPQYYDSREEAQADIDDFLASTREAGMSYTEEDYRVVEVEVGAST